MMMMTIRCTAADLDKRPQNKERVNNISLSLHRRSCTRWSSQSAHHLLNTSIREEDEDGGRWRGNDYCKYMTMCLVSFFFFANSLERKATEPGGSLMRWVRHVSCHQFFLTSSSSSFYLFNCCSTSEIMNRTSPHLHERYAAAEADPLSRFSLFPFSHSMYNNNKSIVLRSTTTSAAMLYWL